MSDERQETVLDIEAEMRDAKSVYDRYRCGGADCDVIDTFATISAYADRLEAARKREAEKIERIVRDAVVDYNGMYTYAPNDEAEREVVERAETANEWLKTHGMEPEPFYYSKEETPCL